ncbi:MAG: DUF2878 domain-containing protein [Pseudomonadota bacterium]
MTHVHTQSGYPKLLNFVLFQAIWFGCILWRDAFEPIAFALIALHLLLCRNRTTELGLMLSCGLFGIAIDSALSIAGVFEFADAQRLLPVPLWLMAIWFGFAATLRHGLQFFVARAFILLPLAAIGAPLNYLAAERFGAVVFPLGGTQTAILVSAVWVLISVKFVISARFFDKLDGRFPHPSTQTSGL